MFIEDLINKLSDRIEKKINQSILISFQEYLLKAGIFTLVSQILAIFIVICSLLLILFTLLSIMLSFNIFYAIILAIFVPTIAFVLIIFMKIEKRAGEIENSIPDFLRQLSSMLRVGLSLENALVDMSNHGKGPLYDELRRVVVEIRMGKSLDESFNNMAIRLNSKDLERSFKIILNAHKSGGSLSDIILDVSDDLRAMLVLKRERKASVMMSIMFLIIASTVAAPFALGMVGVYSAFMIDLGKGGAICEVAPLAAEIYLIIHSILAGFLIALIMYGDLKKGLRYSIPITCSAFLVFYLINNFGAAFFGLIWRGWKMKKETFSFKNRFINDDNGQGSAELILIIGGIIVIILIVVSMYKSYLVELGTELDSNEINTLNSSFSDIASKFE